MSAPRRTQEASRRGPPGHRRVDRDRPGDPRGIRARIQSWGRIDDENHFAPTLCTAIPGTARISESGDVATHGAKLYYLYAKDRDAYLARLGEGQPLGQVIVKESFKAAEPDPNEKTQTTIFGVGAVNGPAYAKKDGKLWRPGAPAELFVMFRRGDANDPTTDDGWLYATTSFDGKTIYSNGPVGSCMASPRQVGGSSPVRRREGRALRPELSGRGDARREVAAGGRAAPRVTLARMRLTGASSALPIP